MTSSKNIGVREANIDSGDQRSLEVSSCDTDRPTIKDPVEVGGPNENGVADGRSQELAEEQAKIKEDAERFMQERAPSRWRFYAFVAAVIVLIVALAFLSRSA